MLQSIPAVRSQFVEGSCIDTCTQFFKDLIEKIQNVVMAIFRTVFCCFFSEETATISASVTTISSGPVGGDQSSANTTEASIAQSSAVTESSPVQKQQGTGEDGAAGTAEPAPANRSAAAEAAPQTASDSEEEDEKVPELVPPAKHLGRRSSQPEQVLGRVAATSERVAAMRDKVASPKGDLNLHPPAPPKAPRPPANRPAPVVAGAADAPAIPQPERSVRVGSKLANLGLALSAVAEVLKHDNASGLDGNGLKALVTKGKTREEAGSNLDDLLSACGLKRSPHTGTLRPGQATLSKGQAQNSVLATSLLSELAALAGKADMTGKQVGAFLRIGGKTYGVMVPPQSNARGTVFFFNPYNSGALEQFNRRQPFVSYFISSLGLNKDEICQVIPVTLKDEVPVPKKMEEQKESTDKPAAPALLTHLPREKDPKVGVYAAFVSMPVMERATTGNEIRPLSPQEIHDLLIKGCSEFDEGAGMPVEELTINEEGFNKLAEKPFEWQGFVTFLQEGIEKTLANPHVRKDFVEILLVNADQTASHALLGSPVYKQLPNGELGDAISYQFAVFSPNENPASFKVYKTIDELRQAPLARSSTEHTGYEIIG